MTVKRFLIAFSLLIFFQQNSFAQEIKGFIYEYISSNPIWNADIKNVRTNQIVQSNKDGSFKIDGQINDRLVISNTGYLTDTIFYYEEAIRRIYLNRNENVITIDEVLVRRLTDSRLNLEIEKAKIEGKAIDATQQRGGIRVSPSRVFSQKAKDARKNLELLQAEKKIREVDRIFTSQRIASITPLTLEEIALFKERYRPNWDFIKNASPEDINIYILDSYKKFKSGQ